jgi:hypothetical protein
MQETVLRSTDRKSVNDAMSVQMTKASLSTRLKNQRLPFKPGWRNWQTQRTQNPPVLSTLGVRLPLPAPVAKSCD